jgi:predicted aspartyl protease
MIDTYDYDPHFDPAMPIVSVRLRSLYPNSKAIQLSALIDSGSDGTMIPLHALDEVHARKVGMGTIRGVAGGHLMVDLYEVLLQVGAFELGKFLVVGDRQNEDMILGRDVLNQLVVTLNGLALVSEISS